jgi:acyl carrier protein
VVLEELPLTPDGEYDLAALPEPEQPAEEVRGFVEPRTPIERQLAGVFRQLLGVERVGVHDSFFALGGSSLQATVVTSRIYDDFDINLSLVDMFANSTVAELSQIVVETLGERAGEQTIKRRRRSLAGIGLAIHGKLPLRLRRLIPPGVPCGGSPGDGKRRLPAAPPE